VKNIPEPIFKDKLSQISWKNIYAREYGVQYSEMAIFCLTDKAKYHIPHPSLFQIVVPEGNNTAFYIDDISWVKLVESLNTKYSSRIKKLEEYENEFIRKGEEYLTTSQAIARLDLTKATDKQLHSLYRDYQRNLFSYSVYAWTSFILNNYVAERAEQILDIYLKKTSRENDKQLALESLFQPTKKAAVLQLQDEVEKNGGKLFGNKFENLYRRFCWLSCLDIHNKPWTRNEFSRHIKSFTKTEKTIAVQFEKFANELNISKKDIQYLHIAKRFVYIKDARDDYRRQGVYHALKLFKELAKRMGITPADVSYLQEGEILSFLKSNQTVDKKIIKERKQGFVLYLDRKRKLVCLSGTDAVKMVKTFHLPLEEKEQRTLSGTVASKGIAGGKVVIVRGVKDLPKVEKGNILVAVTTHPDYVPAMRRSAAIVTDEGGITSHAAIVSREFGIPCIVGTKNATTVFKDGHTVDVNAIDGWVRRT